MQEIEERVTRIWQLHYDTTIADKESTTPSTPSVEDDNQKDPHYTP